MFPVDFMLMSINKQLGRTIYKSDFAVCIRQKYRVLNALENGIQAISKPPGTVSIRTFVKKETNEAVIAIEDSGCGIDPTSLQNISRRT